MDIILKSAVHYAVWFFFLYLFKFLTHQKTFSACAHRTLDIIRSTLSAALKDTPVKKSFLWTLFSSILLCTKLWGWRNKNKQKKTPPRIISTQASSLPTKNRPIPAGVKRYFNIQSLIRHLGKESNSKKNTT